MKQIYEELIALVEEKEVTEESDRVLTRLGEEMSGSERGPALSLATDFLLKTPVSAAAHDSRQPARETDPESVFRKAECLRWVHLRSHILQTAS